MPDMCVYSAKRRSLLAYETLLWSVRGAGRRADRCVLGRVLSRVAPVPVCFHALRQGALPPVVEACGQWTDRAAARIWLVTASGWEMSVRCEPPATSTMWECARLAMSSSDCGVMI
jgi:hypothetical protein